MAADTRAVSPRGRTPSTIADKRKSEDAGVQPAPEHRTGNDAAQAINGKASGGLEPDREQPSPTASHASPEVTVVTNNDGVLSKSIALGADGKPVPTPAAQMAAGSARRMQAADVHALAEVIRRLTRNEAITLGSLRPDLPNPVCIVTKNKLNGAPGVAARDTDHLVFEAGRPAFALFDYDSKGKPPAIEVQDFWQALLEVVPALRDAARVTRHSTSSGLFRTDTNEDLPGSSGVHVYVQVVDGSDVGRFLATLHERCWLAGFGWIVISKAGRLLERSIIDKTVGSPERLVFEAPPVLKKPLAQHAERREPVAVAGKMVDTQAVCPPLTASERARLDELVAQAKIAAQPEADQVRAGYVDENAEAMATRTGMPKEEAVRVLESQCGGVLMPAVELVFTDKNLKGCTVGDVLADPKRFEGKSLADPNEGTSYGRSTATVWLRRSDGHPWIKSFAHGGCSYSLESGADVGVKLENFYAYMPMHNYIFAPSREPWPAASVNARIPPIVIGTDEKGKDIKIKASVWIDKNQPVEMMTWAPGLPMIITDRLIANGGWIEREDVACFNLYRPPTIKLGDASKAGPWLRHVHKIYPTDANHIVKWFAARVQHPEVKINHALVLGSDDQGIGKDTMIEPVKRAIGHWNFDEVSPQMIMGEFTGFLRNVILRINEARDLGDVNRYQFYDHMKAFLAAPPDVLRVNEKHLREYSVLNCVGAIITSNHKTDGIYLPAEDRRHYVAWSESRREDFNAAYWKKLWGWYEAGGDQHVAAYLTSLDISDFDPKAPPQQTPAFWAIVEANRAPEEGELADVLDKLGNPDAVTLTDVADAAVDRDFVMWLEDRKNRRAIPHRFNAAGYVPVRNDARDTGLWVVGGVRQVVYAKKSLAVRDRLKAVGAMQRAVAKKEAEARKELEARRAKPPGNLKPPPLNKKGVRF